MAFAETMGEGSVKPSAPVKDFFKKSKKK